MKRTIFAIALISSMATVGAPAKELTLEQIETRKAEIRKRIYAKTGGVLNRKITKGRRLPEFPLHSID